VGFHGSLPLEVVRTLSSLDFARDFGSGLKRPLKRLNFVLRSGWQAFRKPRNVGHPGGHRPKKSKAADRSVRRTQALPSCALPGRARAPVPTWPMLLLNSAKGGIPRLPPVWGCSLSLEKHVPRLRPKLASRPSCSARDDKRFENRETWGTPAVIAPKSQRRTGVSAPHKHCRAALGPDGRGRPSPHGLC